MLGRRGSYGIVYRYLLKEFFVSFAIAFAFFFSIFFVNEVLTRIGDLIAQDVPRETVFKMAIYLLPMSIPFDIPFAVLVGALMTLGRMVGDKEILVLRAGGISFARLFGPALLLGLVLSGVGIFFNDVVIPRSYSRVTEIMESLVVEDPNVQITPYSVVSMSNVKIVVGDVNKGVVENPLILQKNKEGNLEAIVAESGVIKGDPANWRISSVLENTYTLVTNKRQKYDYQWFTSDEMELNIFLDPPEGNTVWDIPGMTTKELWDEFSKRQQRYDREVEEHRLRVQMTQASIFAEYWDLTTYPESLQGDFASALAGLNRREGAYRIESSTVIPKRNAPYYGSEFFKKLAIHIAPLLFMFLAFPLGLRSSRKGKVQGFLVGLVIAMLYWFLLYMSTVFVLYYNFPPFISTWIGNVAVFLFGTILALRSIKR